MYLKQVRGSFVNTERQAAHQRDKLNVCASLVSENQWNDHKFKENVTKKETYKKTQYIVQKQSISNMSTLVVKPQRQLNNMIMFLA